MLVLSASAFVSVLSVHWYLSWLLLFLHFNRFFTFLGVNNLFLLQFLFKRTLFSQEGRVKYLVITCTTWYFSANVCFRPTLKNMIGIRVASINYVNYKIRRGFTVWTFNGQHKYVINLICLMCVAASEVESVYDFTDDISVSFWFNVIYDTALFGLAINILNSSFINLCFWCLIWDFVWLAVDILSSPLCFICLLVVLKPQPITGQNYNKIMIE